MSVHPSELQAAGGDAKILPIAGAAISARRQRCIRQQVIEVQRLLAGALQTADPDDLESAIFEANRILCGPVIDLCRRGGLA